MEQPIIIRSTHKYSENLNELFFENLADKFDLIFDYSFDKTYELFFSLKPTKPPKFRTRLSWWDSYIVCMEFSNAEWKMSSNKIWNVNDIFNDNILTFGEVKIKNDS